ncbi:hypothetical protein D3C71_1084210 [compost metagenome]
MEVAAIEVSKGISLAKVIGKIDPQGHLDPLQRIHYQQAQLLVEQIELHRIQQMGTLAKLVGCPGLPFAFPLCRGLKAAKWIPVAA